MTTAQDSQVQILRHSLGLTRSATAYRNHFVTGHGSDDHPICMALVDAGLMQLHPPSALTGGDDCFTVTEKGRAYAIEHAPKPPKLTRSQRRYEAYLDADCGMTFGEWLKGRK
jgi:hypothetical protein